MAYVLIVDDDDDFASAVATVLRGEGYEVAAEPSPEPVLARVGERRPDVIVLDVMFPENASAGFEVARVVRRTYEDMPILMLTAVNQQFPLGFSNRDIDPTWLPDHGVRGEARGLSIALREAEGDLRQLTCDGPSRRRRP